MIAFSDFVVGILIVLTVPAAFLFPIIYAFTTRWRETLVGQSLLVKSSATLLLMTLAMLVRVFEISEFWASIFRLVVMAAICVGVNMMFVALIRDKWPLMRGWRRNYHGGTSDDAPLA